MARGIPAGCDPEDEDEGTLPPPALLADLMLERAWDDDTDDASRLLLEQGGLCVRRLMRRCVTLASAAEQREARVGKR